MSIALMALAWPLDIPTTEKMVLLALADAANDAGVTWIAVRSKTAKKMDLLKKCSLSERALQGAIKRLVVAGHLSRKEVPGKGVTYTVHPISTPAANAPRSKCAPQQTAQTPAADAGKPSVTVIKDEANASSKARVSKRNGFALPDWVPAEAWAGYEQMRCKARKPMTDRARALALTKLQELAASGHPPGEVLDQSTLNNWQGLFEIKERNNGNSLGRHHGQGGGERRPSASIDWIERNLGRASEADEGPHGVHRGTLVAFPSSAGR